MADTGEFLAAEPRVGVVTLHAIRSRRASSRRPRPMYPTVAQPARPRRDDRSRRRRRRIRRRSPTPIISPLRIDEINTDSCGAAPGVSNAFVSALWALDALFEMARVGVDGVNIHTYPGRHLPAVHVHPRAPVERVGGPRVLRPRHVRPGRAGGIAADRTTITNAQGITAWATRGRAGPYARGADQREPRPPHGRGERRRHAVRRRSSGCARHGSAAPRGSRSAARASATETTTAAGSPAARPSPSSPPSHGRYEFTLPAESAALVTLP